MNNVLRGNTNNMAISSFQAAKKVCELSGWTITNLGLQKILYLIHMIYAGRNKDRLIDEDFEAWDYGPVLPKLYHKVKCFGNKSIQNIFYDEEEPLNSLLLDFIKDSYKYFSENTPSQLVAMTHSQNGGWWIAYNPLMKKNKIPFESILAEYEKITSKK